MIDLKWIRENPELFEEQLAKRFLPSLTTKINSLDEQKRQLITITQQLKQAKNNKAKLIAQLKDHNSDEFKQLMVDSNDLKTRINELEKKLTQQDELTELLYHIPNILDSEVPTGKDENDNIEIKAWGKIPIFNFQPKAHDELMEQCELIDFTQTAKISGSRFVTLKAGLAKLERALINFMLDIHTNLHDYTEISVPQLVKPEAMFGVGQLPKFADESFLTTNNYRLIPTGEVPLTNLVRESILSATDLPIRYVTYSLCFRSEAGSAGRDTKGMIRQHQFGKVELVSITKPEDSAAEHERLTNAAEEILRRLELPYRLMLLCSGDTGFTARKTYDLEVWLPSQNKYREISSCSNCGDFQARRMKARYRNDQQNNIFVHTLNGSGLAVGRTIVAIIENYQTNSGKVKIPAVLIPYMNGIVELG